MKILMVLEHDFHKDLRVQREALSLVEKGYDLDIITVNQNHIFENETYKGITIFKKHIPAITKKSSAFLFLFPLYFIFWERYLKSVLKNKSYDALHIHDLPLMKIGIKLRSKFGYKLIGDFHENRPEIMKLYHHTNTIIGKLFISIKKWKKYQVKASKETDRLILVTEEAKNYYVDKYKIQEEKISVIPNYPDVKEIDALTPDKEIVDRYKDNFMIIYFGDTSLRRGTKDILLAARQLEKEPTIKFVIIGYNKKEQQKLETYIKNHHIKNVELLGFVKFSKAISYFKASSAGISPLHRNVHHDTTYAAKIFQYMCFKKPVIVSDCPAQKTVIETSNLGVVFESKNINDLVEKTLTLKTSKNYMKICQDAREAVVSKYNWGFSSKELLKLYNNLNN